MAPSPGMARSPGAASWTRRLRLAAPVLGALVLGALVLGVGLPPARAQEGGGSSATPVVFVVTGDDVNLRSGPSIDHHDLGRASRGDLVMRAGVDGEFVRVTVPGGPVVHVFAALVDWTPDGDGTTDPVSGPLLGTVRTDDVLMRATPAQAYLPLHDQKLRTGDELVVLGVSDGDDGRWLRVIAPQRVHVWIHQRYVKPVESVLSWSRWEELAAQRHDALSGGRTRAARRDAHAAVRAEAVRGIEALEARARDGHATSADVRAAEVLRMEAPDPDLRERARLVRESLREARAAEERRELADTAERARREVEEMAREQAEREERYQRQMDAIEKARPRASRGVPLDEGVIALRPGGRVVLLHGQVVARRLVSHRLRLADYAGRRVRVWGTPGGSGDAGSERFEVTSLEILPAAR